MKLNFAEILEEANLNYKAAKGDQHARIVSDQVKSVLRALVDAINADGIIKIKGRPGKRTKLPPGLTESEYRASLGLS